MFPFSCLVFAAENVLLCLDGESFYSSVAARTCLDAVYALHTCLVPVWLVHSFEICYLIHKKRSVNWCGIYFDEGHRVKTNLKSFLLRNCIGILAIILLSLGVVVNFDLIKDDEIDVLAGKVGWHDLVKSDRSNDFKLHLFLSLLPMGALFITNLFLSISMWKYGSSMALVIYPSYFNPWIQHFIGTLFMGIGQLFGEELYPSTSNIGQAIFLLSLVKEMKEVEKELDAEEEFEIFLESVKQVGNSVASNANPSAEDTEYESGSV